LGKIFSITPEQDPSGTFCAAGMKRVLLSAVEPWPDCSGRSLPMDYSSANGLREEIAEIAAEGWSPLIITVDTNVLVQAALLDDPEQAQRAVRSSSAPIAPRSD